jgi:S-adenosyl-L-methionine hydrolase (adenosine-forming)
MSQVTTCSEADWGFAEFGLKTKKSLRSSPTEDSRVAAMIVLFTDFGLEGPYTGQVKAVLSRAAPSVPVIDLFADLPAGKPKPAAYLLGAYSLWFPAGTVFLAVVDPGVGGARAAIVVEAEGRWYVGPDNGLFEIVIRRAGEVRCWEVSSRPEQLSASFHGRDLFAPVAGQLAGGAPPDRPGRPAEPSRYLEWPDDLSEIVYIDRYGNAITGLRAAMLPAEACLAANGRSFERHRTFSDVPVGEAFWYENANGLAEIAVNAGRADTAIGLTIGSSIATLP